MSNIIALVKINEELTLENEQLKFQLRDKSNGEAVVNKKLTTESNGPTVEAEETATTLIQTIANLCGAEYEDEIYLIETVTKTLNDYHQSQVSEQDIEKVNEYGLFCVICDRENTPLLSYQDYLKHLIQQRKIIIK